MVNVGNEVKKIPDLEKGLKEVRKKISEMNVGKPSVMKGGFYDDLEKSIKDLQIKFDNSKTKVSKLIQEINDLENRIVKLENSIKKNKSNVKAKKKKGE